MNEIDRITRALTPATAQQLEDMDVDAEVEMEMQQEPTERKQPRRFRISVHQNGYYQVSIPNYHGGEVVTAENHDALIEALRRIRNKCQSVVLAGYQSAHSFEVEIGDIEGEAVAALSAVQERSQ